MKRKRYENEPFKTTPSDCRDLHWLMPDDSCVGYDCLLADKICNEMTDYKFKTFQQFNRCAKAWALLVVYHNPDSDGASREFCQAVFNYVEKELIKMNLPEGWNQHAEYHDFKEWFIKNT